MNILGYKITHDNGFAVDIEIDNLSLNIIFKTKKMSLAGAYIESDFPNYPPSKKISNGRKIVAICSCGEYGCNNINCLVNQAGNKITWTDFNGNVQIEDKNKQFEFDPIQYFIVIREIQELTVQYFNNKENELTKT